MSEEVNELLDKLGSMEDAPLIWINQRVGNLITENKQLKDRINKAVEYINDLYIDFYNYGCDKLIVGKYMVNDLLDLLKGDTNE